MSVLLAAIIVALFAVATVLGLRRKQLVGRQRAATARRKSAPVAMGVNPMFVGSGNTSRQRQPAGVVARVNGLPSRHQDSAIDVFSGEVDDDSRFGYGGDRINGAKADALGIGEHGSVSRATGSRSTKGQASDCTPLSTFAEWGSADHDEHTSRYTALHTGNATVAKTVTVGDDDESETHMTLDILDDSMDRGHTAAASGLRSGNLRNNLLGLGRRGSVRPTAVGQSGKGEAESIPASMTAASDTTDTLSDASQAVPLKPSVRMLARRVTVEETDADDQHPEMTVNPLAAILEDRASDHGEDTDVAETRSNRRSRPRPSVLPAVLPSHQSRLRLRVEYRPSLSPASVAEESSATSDDILPAHHD